MVSSTSEKANKETEIAQAHPDVHPSDSLRKHEAVSWKDLCIMEGKTGSRYLHMQVKSPNGAVCISGGGGVHGACSQDWVPGNGCKKEEQGTGITTVSIVG